MKTSSLASVNQTPALTLQDSSDPAQSRAGDTAKALEPTKFLLHNAATPSRTKIPKSSFSFPISATSLNADPDIAALMKTQRQLENQLRVLKEELETAEQAKRIEADSEKKNPGGAIDGELSQLIVKWKIASRRAAEELFTGVRDRVNRYTPMRLLIWHLARRSQSQNCC